MSTFDSPMGFSPRYTRNEEAGLKDDAPMLIKLVNAAEQRQTMPGKCPSAFGITVGYTLPFRWTSHYALWQVIPADIELRENHLIFTPAPKAFGIQRIIPPKEEIPEEVKTPQPAKARPKAETPPPEPVEKGKPTYLVKYLRLPLGTATSPAQPIGVTFLTGYHNHRLTWHIMPTAEELAKGLLLLDPWMEEEEEEDEAAPRPRWWQRG